MKESLLAIILTLTGLAGGLAQAAPPEQPPEGNVYVVQADDWLSKLAGKFYGDIFAYPAIVEATNAKAAEDNSFAIIDNPDLIEIGQKLWIPTTAGSTSSQGPTPANIVTEVINYVPAVPATTVEGNCWTSSIAAPGSKYAWRCSVGNAIYDPCLTAVDGQTIVCGIPDREFGLKLTEPLPAPETANLPPRPWLIELENGVTCGPFTGTLPPIEENAPYGCSDKAVIVGDLQQGPTWYATKAMLEPNDSGPLPFRVGEKTLVPVLKVWLVGEPAKN